MDGAIVEDIRCVLTKRLDWEFGFIFREGNRIAHELAKRALQTEGECCSIEDGLTEINSIVIKEMICNEQVSVMNE